MTEPRAADRYERMFYRRCGHSGLLLPVISLGFWHNLGNDDDPLVTGRATARHTARPRWQRSTAYATETGINIWAASSRE
jgi:aryl-alcohol dehydrogenase-like predicted oxidoreductase